MLRVRPEIQLVPRVRVVHDEEQVHGARRCAALRLHPGPVADYGRPVSSTFGTYESMERAVFFKLPTYLSFLSNFWTSVQLLLDISTQ